MPENAVRTEENQGLDVRKEQMMLQGKEEYAMLEVDIGRLFLSVPMGCKMQMPKLYHTCRTSFSRQPWISLRTHTPLLTASSFFFFKSALCLNTSVSSE